jgi:choline dehydrogenase-like flavoprotein
MALTLAPRLAIGDGRSLAPGAVDLDADAVVVGTGAGGSMALRELARAGLAAVAVEEGAYLTPRDFNQREDAMLAQLYKDGGGQMTDDRAIRVLQGRGIGGSTVHNTNLCKRTPDAILDIWARKHSVSGASLADLRPSFEAVERDLSVSRIEAPLRNANNDALRLGCEALGWRGGPLSHNRVGCVQSGYCELGCSYDAKQNAAKVLLPQALDAGARVYAHVEATRILHDGRRVAGVQAVVRDAEGRVRTEVSIRSRVVVLGASAVGSAVLARKSGVPDPYGKLGHGLRMHPGAVAAGIFDRPIEGWRGIPQSYECTELLSHDDGSDRRVWIVPAFAHPIGAAATLPGFGARHMSAMRSYPNLAVLTAMVHDETSGEVAVGPDGRAVLRYTMTGADRRQLAKGLAACARLLLAAGAREVTIPAIPPLRATSARDVDALDLSGLRPHALPLSAVHPMGTMRLGDDPRTSVVASTGEHHQLRGLFVADGSLFPTSIGGPPQISIYTFALHLAPHMVARARAG